MDHRFVSAVLVLRLGLTQPSLQGEDVGAGECFPRQNVVLFEKQMTLFSASEMTHSMCVGTLSP